MKSESKGKSIGISMEEKIAINTVSALLAATLISIAISSGL